MSNSFYVCVFVFYYHICNISYNVIAYVILHHLPQIICILALTIFLKYLIINWKSLLKLIYDQITSILKDVPYSETGSLATSRGELQHINNFFIWTFFHGHCNKSLIKRKLFCYCKLKFPGRLSSWNGFLYVASRPKIVASDPVSL